MTGTHDGAAVVTAVELEKLMADAGDKPVFVDFYAEWCGPCKMAAPVVNQLAKTYEGKAVVVKVDVDEERELAQKYGVMSIPTTIVFKRQNGETKAVARQVGYNGPQVFTDMVEQALKA